ncbi:MAG: SIMPL domain-containing protein [Treponemataceae bacterium]
MEKQIGSIVLAFGVLLAGVSIALGLVNMKSVQRSVTVRGLSEREVDADFAVWPLTFSVAGNDPAALYTETLAKTTTVKKFLSTYNFSDSEITVNQPAITDVTANPYIKADDYRNKYIAKSVVLVRSANIVNVKKAILESIELLQEGIALIQDYDSQVAYSYNALNDIKPEMIADATKNARLAAEQFARDSGSKVGKIKNATQGLFSIENAGASLPEKKNVRVVTTVEYFLVD